MQQPLAVVCFALVLGTPAAAAAQIPKTFTNLQVLPKDIPRAELVATSLNIVATSLRDRKQFDEALEILRLNATMFPKSAMVQVNLGDTAAQKGDLPRAERFYARAIEIEPGNAIALKSLEGVRARTKKGGTP